MISALSGDGVDDLRRALASAVPAGPFLYPEDQMSDAPMRHLAAELTREKIYSHLHQELPYQSTVETDSWTERKDGSVRIEQTIYVERESQRKIVLGKGGATIRQITEETHTTIDITDDGTVKIASVDRADGEAARRRIELITADVEVGAVYQGRVSKLMDFGAFVTILPGRDGLVHISQISDERVERVSDKLKEGDIVDVKVLEVDRQGRIRLSMKAVNAPTDD
jgi:polyribonucleotide nucleotidyltransferase